MAAKDAGQPGQRTCSEWVLAYQKPPLVAIVRLVIATTATEPKIADNMLLPDPLPKPYRAENLDLFSEGMFTVKEAANHVRMNRATLYRAMAKGSLPFYKKGKVRRIPRTALRIWMEVD